MQTILYYKYLGFSLKEIKSLMKQDEDDLLPHLKHQLKLMQKEKDRLLTLIDTLERRLRLRKGNDDDKSKKNSKGLPS